ncbi:hypothetical protein JTB14_005551 [Gonioctena quinquepunctata]|nr:hypothetical protein JTB14_005551 [Gonioctena quinquepunctata]
MKQRITILLTPRLNHIKYEDDTRRPLASRLNQTLIHLTENAVKVPVEEVFDYDKCNRWKIVRSTRDQSAQEQSVEGETKLKATPRPYRTALE